MSKSATGALRSALLLACSTGFAWPALAQEAPEEVSITVTGSRIQGLPADGPSPVVQISREEIEETASAELIEALRDLTITSGGRGTFSTSTSGALSGDTPAGSSGVSLRGLGTSATLTLINGRRASISAFANGQESFIDVNSIPSAAIERIEVLPSGASAIYGADAVAGVVNFVLRKDFEGAEFAASYGDSTADSDEGRLNLNGVLGRRFGDNHFMLVVDYFKRNALYDRDRDISKDSVRPSQQGFYPSFNDLFDNVVDQTEEPADGGCPAQDFKIGRFGEYCQVDTNDFSSTQDELESLGGVLTHEWEINPRLTWFNELIYQKTESRATSSPANFSRAPIDPENPFWPTALQQDLAADAGYSSFSSFFGFPIFAWGKFLDPRAVEVESESLRFTSGVEGKIGDTWSYEASLLYGSNERVQSGLSGLVLTRNFYDLLLGNVCTDGSRVRRWDVNPARPSASQPSGYVTCEDSGRTTLWYNPFGGQTQQSPGVEALLNTKARREGESELWSVNAFASGDLGTFLGRTVKTAFGAEFRREEVTDVPSRDALATTANPEPILGFSSTSSDAERDQWALFAELYVPLSDSLEFQLAGRYDEYDDFGGDFNPKVSFRWAPAESFILRGNWSTSFRAPSLAQSGAGTFLSFTTVDCEAVPGACDNDPTEDGEDLFSEEVANPNLEAEEAESWGVGVVVKPARRTELSLDYWNIRHENLIGIDEDDFIRRALAGEFPVVGQGLLPSGSPGLEVRNGFVTDAHFQLTNLGYQETSGLDAALAHDLDLGGYGALQLSLNATYLLEFERRASDTAPVEDLAGDFRYPELLLRGRARWVGDRLAASLTGNYTSSYDDDPSPSTLAAAGLPANAQVEVDSWLVWDANFSFDYSDTGRLSLNVQNILDEEPPRVLGTGANVDHVNHDSLGRFVTLRVRQSF